MTDKAIIVSRTETVVVRDPAAQSVAVASKGGGAGQPLSANVLFTQSDVVLGRATAGAGIGEEIPCNAFGRSVMAATVVAGSLLFAASASAIGTDNANLFWDNAAKRLGIGTTAPVAALHVYEGDVWIGHTGSVLQRVLAIAGKDGTSVNDMTGVYVLEQTNGKYFGFGFQNGVATFQSFGGSTLSFNASGNDVSFGLGPAMTVKSGGNVLIATTSDYSAAYKLQVAGSILSRVGTGGNITLAAATTSGNAAIPRIQAEDQDGAGVWYFGKVDGASPDVAFIQRLNGPMQFWTNNTEAARIVGAGRVLIGTTTDDGANKFQVAGGVNFGGSTGLTWDNTNKRLGLGTNAPVVALDVTGALAVNPGTFFSAVDSTAQFVVSGTTAPAYISLNENIQFYLRGNQPATAGVTSRNSVALRWVGHRWNGSASVSLQGQAMLKMNATADDCRIAFGFTDNNDEMLNITHRGNVLIGTTTDDGVNKLQVAGGVSVNGAYLIGAANVLEQRNGASAQAFHVYNTYTDASNYERLYLLGVAGSRFQIGTAAAGTGVERRLQFAALDFAFSTTAGAVRWIIDTSGHFNAGADNTYDFGQGAFRPRTLYLGTSIVMGADVVLTREAAGVFAQRNGTNAQESRIYMTYTDSSNYERLTIKANTNGSPIITTECAGTGSLRFLYLKGTAGVILSANTANIVIDTGGNVYAGDNAQDFGLTGNRWRTGYFATSVVVAATSGNVNGLTLSSAATGVSPSIAATGADVNIGLTLRPKGSGALFAELYTAKGISFFDSSSVGSRFAVNSYGTLEMQSNGTCGFAVTDAGGVYARFSNTGFGISDNASAGIGTLVVFVQRNGNGMYVGTSSSMTKQFEVSHTASAVNYVNVTGAATGNGVTISALGSDANIGITLTPKGTGVVNVNGVLKIGNTVNAVSPTAPNRTITIDVGGTTYYLHAKTTND